MSLQFSRAVLGGLFLAGSIGAVPAFAADAKQIADSLVAAVTASGKTTASYSDAAAAGDDVTITGYTMTQTDGDGETITIPTIVIRNAQPRDAGGFTADSMSFDGGRMTGDTTVTWQTGSLSDATVPSPEEIKAKAKLRPFSNVSVTGLNVSGGDLPAPIDIGNIGATIDVQEDGTPRDFTLDIASISLPPALFADPQQKAMLDALGYTDGFTLNMSVAGGYETANDTLTLRTFSFDTADVGKLTISGKFSGVPMSSFAQDQSTSDIAATGKLESVTIRFENAGIVERALDMQAKMMGASREAVVAQIGGALPFMLNAIGNQPFQDKVAAAGQAFLADPQSITITAAPAEPVAFTTIGATVTSGPQTLPDLLAVDIVANN